MWPHGGQKPPKCENCDFFVTKSIISPLGCKLYIIIVEMFCRAQKDLSDGMLHDGTGHTQRVQKCKMAANIFY